MTLTAPFPWFGGKRRIAHVVWERFGDAPNYVEPFAGSLAVLLGRPHAARTETVNDKDAYVANFWRAVQHDPEQVAYYADYPVNEVDLHARHAWLVTTGRERVEALLTDPEHFDAKVAGWWVWGLCMWIGGGWCAEVGDGRLRRPALSNGGMGILTWQQRPDLAKRGNGRGVLSTSRRRPVEQAGARGVYDVPAKRPQKGGGHGVHRLTVPQQVPDIAGDSGATGRGMNASALDDRGGLVWWFEALAERLRRVRVCCGDWTRILGPSPTWKIGPTAVLLDPPYSHDERTDGLYAQDHDIADDVREWAIANGDNPLMRIALCGYDGEHDMPGSWSVVAWKAHGGYGPQRKDGTVNQNAWRERVWFSPHCLLPQRGLFDALEVPA